MRQELSYDEAIAGAKLIVKKTGGYNKPPLELGFFSNSIIYWTTEGDTYICTGYYYQADGFTYVQVTSGSFIAMNLSSDSDKQRLTFVNDAYFPPKKTDKEAQVVVNQIVSNDFKITQNNLFCARFAHYLTREEKQLVYDLQSRVNKRNDALKFSSCIEGVESGSPSGYEELSPYLEKLMNGAPYVNAIGLAITTWIIIVVVALVVVGLGTAAYYSFKAFADESAQDVKYSDELTKKLMEKLTPEEYEQLMEETKGIVTKARLKQATKSYGNVLLYAGIAVGGYLAYKVIKDYVL